MRKLTFKEELTDFIADLECGTHEWDAYVIDADMQTDKLVALLPAMIPDLQWDGFVSGHYEIRIQEGGMANLYFHSFYEDGDEPECLQGGYLSLISMDEFKAIANEHNRAQIMQALGLGDG